MGCCLDDLTVGTELPLLVMIHQLFTFLSQRNIKEQVRESRTHKKP